MALKGSWNRSQPTGYKVVRVPFKDGKPQGYYQNFATGFWISGQNRAEVWGRPTALAVMKDGSYSSRTILAEQSGAFLTMGRNNKRINRQNRSSGLDHRRKFVRGPTSTATASDPLVVRKGQPFS